MNRCARSLLVLALVAATSSFVAESHAVELDPAAVVWWIGTGNRFDPANLTVPMKPGTFVTHFGNRVHWDGAKDKDKTLLIIGEGPQ